LTSFSLHNPEWAWGLSSGWRRPRPLSASSDWPDFAFRKPVQLRSRVQADFVPTKSAAAERDALRRIAQLGGLPIKGGVHPPDAPQVTGLSSGTGSVLLPGLASSLKVKRCGYLDLGLTGEHVVSFADSAQGCADLSFAGLMSLSSAAVELLMAEQMWAEGFLTASRPQGIFVVTERLSGEHRSHRFGAIVYQACSDVRADEVVLQSVSRALAAQIGARQLAFDSKRNVFVDIPSQHSGAELPVQIDDLLVAQTAQAAGSAYRRLHDAGYVRGRGSAWFGNDMVTPDGRIELIDYDGGFRKPGSSEPLQLLCDLELAEYSASTIGYLAWAQSLGMAKLALLYDQEFRSAYRNAGERRIDLGLLRDTVESNGHAHAILREVLKHEDAV
jgi:hypothetical protein